MRALHGTIGAYVLLVALLSTALLSGCGSSQSVGIYYTAWYFQMFYTPSSITGTSNSFCAKGSESQWYVYIAIDEIDNSKNTDDFTYDPSLIQPLNSQTDPAENILQGYLASYWQWGKITVPTGITFNRAQVHQGQFFLLNYDAATTSAGLADNAPIAYHSNDSSTDVSLFAHQHEVFVPPNSAMPTNNTLANVQTVPLVAGAPCTP